MPSPPEGKDVKTVVLRPSTPAPERAARPTNAATAPTLPISTIGIGDRPATDAGPQEIAALSTPSRYHALEVVGRGGMGVVRGVFDRVLGRTSAMKLLDGAAAGQREFVTRLLEEAKITGQLDHPSIVPVHDFGIVEGGTNAYFTMKLVRGEALGELIERHHEGTFDVRMLERLLGIFLRVCEGIGFAHARRIVHRDIKPANILVGTHGEVYVMDWGVAIVVPVDRPAGAPPSAPTEQIVGTPSFMAPEQADGRSGDIDTRTDVFGLGGLLYAILTGHSPFGGGSMELSLVRASECEIRRPEEVTPHPIPPELARITMKALNKAPGDRYQTADELAHEVQQFLRGGGWFATRSYPAGAVIIAEGEASGEAFVIVTGSCEVYKTTAGVKQPLRTLVPGDVFGETGVIAARPRTASVAAFEPVTVKVVTRESLELELDRNPWMAAFIRAITQRFVELDDRVRAAERAGIL